LLRKAERIEEYLRQRSWAAMSSAKVGSIDALRHLRAVLLAYAEQCRDALVGVEMELGRGVDFVLEKQPQHWKRAERVGQDRVTAARQELSRCRGMAMKGEVPPCSEQKQALDRAVAELRQIEEKRKITRHWGHILDREAQEWQARMQQFAHLFEGELPSALARLDQMIAALEKYASGAAPEATSAPTVAIPLDESLSKSDNTKTNPSNPPSAGELDATS
jgi:hypothetical protein